MQAQVVDFENMLDNLPVVAFRLVYENQTWVTLHVSRNIERYGYAWQDFMEKRITWIDIVHPDDRVLAHKLANDYMVKKIDDFRLHYRIVTKRNESIWITEYSHVNRDAGGNVLSVDSTLLNSTEVRVGEEKIKDNLRRQAVLNDILMGLHDADMEMAIQIILGRTGAYLDTSRALLFRDSPDHKTCKVVYEWLNRGITSIKELDYAVTYATEMPEIYIALQDTGILLVNAGEIPENCREEFEKEGLVSSAIFAVYLHGDHYGFVCFDDCVIERVWDEDTVNFLKIVTDLISTVLMRMHTEEKLRISQKTCETVLDNVDSLIFATHPQTDAIIFANRAFRNVFGSDCIGRPGSEYVWIDPVDVLYENESADSEKPRFANFEVFVEKLGKWLAVTREHVPWVDGRSVFLVTCYDITVKKEYETSITRIAYRDHLTGLPNRYRADIDLEENLAAARHSGRPGYLLFMDLDDFKIVNDCYGHDFGDGVLTSVAGFLRDTFHGESNVYRFGGDEFLIIIPHSDGDRIRDYLKAMIDRAQKPWKSLGKEFYCSMSLGVVEFTGCGDDAKSLVKKADIAMYQAKKSGKNSFVFYTEGLDSATLQRSEMEALLRDSMLNDFHGFEVYYQPYSDTRTGKILGAEALVRMRAPDGSLILPSQFIGLAEYLGLIVPLGEHVLAAATRQCGEINAAGLPDFTITVNLSAKQFKQKDIVHRLEGIVASSGVDPRNVIVGINEGVAIDELERMLLLCGEFRKKGMLVALDDFGSGRSSFINMRNLPVDIIRVSSKYIDTIKDRFTGYFLKLVTDLGHFTGKVVCMNGVETEEQLAICHEIGIDQAQGFLLNRPDTVEKLRSILDA